MLPTALPYLRAFRGAFTPVTPAADLDNQIPVDGFILAHLHPFHSLSGHGTFISLTPRVQLNRLLDSGYCILPLTPFQTLPAGVVYWTCRLPSNSPTKV